jgi:DNA repair protein RadA/Sms
MKQKTEFVCQQCGSHYQKWIGKCNNCGSWNSLVEQIIDNASENVSKKRTSSGNMLNPLSINESNEEDSGEIRISTGVDDLDVVLGGGILPGGVILLAGQPGIGKSTLLLQIASSVERSKDVLYVSGEESFSQVRLRSKRLGANNNFGFISSTCANDIVKTIESGKYDLVIVDSIQTISLNELSTAPGTISQITNCTNAIIKSAKATGTAVILVGHVTKEGSIAGPKILEHLVDVVLQFEGDRYGGFKVVRAVKNRYGSTNEAAIFEMFDDGLRIVENPSAKLLEERRDSDGSIILATMDGQRPLLVEVQALVNATNYGYPKRTASGFDLNRLNILIAIIEHRTKLKLSDKDIFVNIVGGVKIQDHAADLAVCMAIASAAAERKIDSKTVVFGEVGLGGEIRSARQTAKRVQEAKKLGFTKAIAPSFNANDGPKFIEPAKDLRSILIKYLQ